MSIESTEPVAPAIDRGRIVVAAIKVALYFLIWIAISLGSFFGSGGVGHGQRTFLEDVVVLLTMQLFPVAFPLLMLALQGRRILPWLAGGGVIGTISEGRFFISEIGRPNGLLFFIVMLAGLVTGFTGSIGLIVNAIRDRKWELAFACSPLPLLYAGMWWLTRAWFLAD